MLAILMLAASASVAWPVAMHMENLATMSAKQSGTVATLIRRQGSTTNDRKSLWAAVVEESGTG